MLMHELMADWDRFLRDHRKLLAWIAIAVTLSYGFAVVSSSLSIDEEVQLRMDHRRAFTYEGRFGITLLKLLLGNAFPLPFFEPAVAVLILSVSTLIWCFVFVRLSDHKLGRSPWLTLFAVIYSTMPTNAYYLAFNTFNLELSCGLALSALSVLFSFVWFDQHSRLAFIVAAACALFANAIYQSLLLF